MRRTTKNARVGGTHTGSPFQAARLKAGLSQEQASEQLDCSPRTIQRYEAGKTMPDYALLRRMMDCYQCEAADLFALPDNKPGGDVK